MSDCITNLGCLNFITKSKSLEIFKYYYRLELQIITNIIRNTKILKTILICIFYSDPIKESHGGSQTVMSNEEEPWESCRLKTIVEHSNPSDSGKITQ